MVRRLAASTVVPVLVAAVLSGCGARGPKIVATFTDVGDLQSRGSVQVADVRVGSIASIHLTKDFRAEVTLALKPGVRVPKDSKALVRTTSLLGEKFIELRPKADPAKGPFLADGDRIPDHDSEEAPELEFIAEQAVEVLGSVSASDLGSLSKTGAQAFGGRQPELTTLIGDISTISSTLAGRTKELTHIIDALDKTTATVAAGSGDVGALLTNLATTTQVLSDNRQRAVNALAKLSALAQAQNVILDRYRTDIDRQIKQLDAIVAVAAKQTGELSTLIDFLNRFVLSLPKVIPGDFTQVIQWAVPAQQDPRVGK
jgi:phospholipid/cholesterol/gamma-HCH transport system substrate-binding protein